jgi:hypothetical protein
MALFGEVRFGKIFVAGGYPRPPTPPNALTGAGFAKFGLQNLEPQWVRGHNLENTSLTRFLGMSPSTANALEMICFFYDGRKVRCHSQDVGAVEFFLADYFQRG